MGTELGTAPAISRNPLLPVHYSRGIPCLRCNLPLPLNPVGALVAWPVGKIDSPQLQVIHSLIILYPHINTSYSESRKETITSWHVTLKYLRDALLPLKIPLRIRVSVGNTLAPHLRGWGDCNWYLCAENVENLGFKNMALNSFC